SRIGDGTVFTVMLPFGSSHLPPEQVAAAPLDHFSTAGRADAYTSEALSWLGPRAFGDLPAGAPGPIVDPPAGPRARVLIADDNADMRDYISRILGGGYEIIPAVNGADALRAAREKKPDVVIADVMMPELDGFGLLKQLRAEEGMREIPFIVLSARAGEE